MDRETMWRCVTFSHDWGDGSFLEHFLNTSVGVGAAGPATWSRVGYSGRRRKVALGADAVGAWLRDMAGRDRDIELGGAEPVEWFLTVHVDPWRIESAEVDGMSMVQLNFSGAPFSLGQGSQRLRDAFRQAHDPRTTEHAAIHPWKPWVYLRAETYQPAVTTGIAFAGLAWANFLGPGHIEDFDRSRLTVSDGFTSDWLAGDDGLFMFCTADLDAAHDSVDVEEQLVLLTKMFHRARLTG